MLVSNVTAPTLANIRPATVADVVAVIDARARIFPMNIELVPKVAEVPTCQKTFEAWAPLMARTTELLAVVRLVPI